MKKIGLTYMMSKYLNLLTKLLYVWDVVFTFIDNIQLKGYIRLKRYIDDKKYGN